MKLFNSTDEVINWIGGEEMKRKIKKGPGKARQMPVKDLRHVVTTYARCPYITAGKTYRVLQDELDAPIYNIIDNLGDV